MKKIIILFFLFSCGLNQLNNESSTITKEEKSEEISDEELCVCMEIYQPVCGKDGKTYANACEAECQKVRHTPGACADY